MEPGAKDYNVVANTRGGRTLHSTLRFNEAETVILSHEEANTIRLRHKPEFLSQGLLSTSISIKTCEDDLHISRTRLKVAIEDFQCLESDKVITANSLGIIEIFRFNIEEQICRKISEFRINSKGSNIGEKADQKPELVTNMAVTRDGQGGHFLAVSTVEARFGTPGSHNENLLKKVIVFRIDNCYNIQRFAVKEFNKKPQEQKSLYYYLNFSYSYKGRKLLLAFQNEGERALDVYALEGDSLELIYSKKGYHGEYFTAIRQNGESVVSVDYDGVMRILTPRKD